ncbi:MAG: hypothetical protein ACJ73N_16440 [Bryobacteraceae bacterium]
MFTCDELTTEIEQILQKKAAEACPPLPLGSESLDLNSLLKAEAIPQRLPLEGADKESRAAELLNLIGCRMWWEEGALVIGYWPCFDGPELWTALSMIEGPITIRPLTDPEVPATYCVCPLPQKTSEESLAQWIMRRRAVLPASVSGHDDTDS